MNPIQGFGSIKEPGLKSDIQKDKPKERKMINFSFCCCDSQCGA